MLFTQISKYINIQVNQTVLNGGDMMQLEINQEALPVYEALASNVRIKNYSIAG